MTEPQYMILDETPFQQEFVIRITTALERIAEALEGNCAHKCGYPDSPCFECELRDEKEARG